MGINTAIILAGGLGTRLQSAVPDVPKCMAPVNGRPFIDYVVDYLRKQGTSQFVFAIGYKAASIQAHLKTNGLQHVQFSIEEKLLGTGGAVKQAATLVQDQNVLVVNGDTLFTANIEQAFTLHHQSFAECTLALKPMKNFDRFGTVLLDESHCVTGFQEKQPTVSGFINGGVYILNLNKWLQHPWPEAFSFENDYLQQHYPKSKIMGNVQDEYFIDIGIPEDYRRAQTEFESLAL
jgi:D-glycero-alpha-D-manno-heptose 1-phosphate guanylyltransferase